MKRLITNNDVIKYLREGNKEIPAGPDDIITPLALDRIESFGLTIVRKDSVEKIEPGQKETPKSAQTNKVAIGSDHSGFNIKTFISKELSSKGYEIIDAGIFNENSCYYPDYAFAIAEKVKEGKADFGIVADATGIPSVITANKLHGIRAAACYNEFSARIAREHSNANILVVAVQSLGEETIKSILEVWLNTGFAGGRHQESLDKITAIENIMLRMV